MVLSNLPTTDHYYYYYYYDYYYDYYYYYYEKPLTWQVRRHRCPCSARAVRPLHSVAAPALRCAALLASQHR